MRELYLVGMTDDRKAMILSESSDDPDGQFLLVVDDAVRGALDPRPVRSRALPRFLSAESADTAESGLSVREMQDRLRHGATVRQVAQEAGVPQEWVERFAPPVQAEQAKVVADLRRMVFSTRRKGPSMAPLGESVAYNLARKGVAVNREEDRWTAHQMHDGVWSVRCSYRSRGRSQVAEWIFDVVAGEVTANDPLAARLAYRDPADPALSPVPAPRPPDRRASAARAKAARKDKAAGAASAPSAAPVAKAAEATPPAKGARSVPPAKGARARPPASPVKAARKAPVAPPPSGSVPGRQGDQRRQAASTLEGGSGTRDGSGTGHSTARQSGQDSPARQGRSGNQDGSARQGRSGNQGGSARQGGQGDQGGFAGQGDHGRSPAKTTRAAPPAKATTGAKATRAAPPAKAARSTRAVSPAKAAGAAPPAKAATPAKAARAATAPGKVRPSPPWSRLWARPERIRLHRAGHPRDAEGARPAPGRRPARTPVVVRRPPRSGAPEVTPAGRAPAPAPVPAPEPPPPAPPASVRTRRTELGAPPIRTAENEPGVGFVGCGCGRRGGVRRRRPATTGAEPSRQARRPVSTAPECGAAHRLLGRRLDLPRDLLSRSHAPSAPPAGPVGWPRRLARPTGKRSPWRCAGR